MMFRDLADEGKEVGKDKNKFYYLFIYLFIYSHNYFQPSAYQETPHKAKSEDMQDGLG